MKLQITRGADESDVQGEECVGSMTLAQKCGSYSTLQKPVRQPQVPPLRLTCCCQTNRVEQTRHLRRAFLWGCAGYMRLKFGWGRIGPY